VTRIESSRVMKQSHYSDREALNSHTTVTANRLNATEANFETCKARHSCHCSHTTVTGGGRKESHCSDLNLKTGSFLILRSTKTGIF